MAQCQIYFEWIKLANKQTLNASPLRTFFCLSTSNDGGDTSITYGFKSEALNNFKLWGCKFKTHIFPLDTTVRIASNDVPDIGYR